MQQVRDVAALIDSEFFDFSHRRAFLLQVVVPPLVGLVLSWASRALRPPRPIPAMAIVAVSALLVYGAGLADWPSILIALTLLGLFAVAACRGGPGRAGPALAGALFAAYIVYWAAAKYALPFAVEANPRLSFVAFHVTPLIFVGISYIGFKLIHFFVDRRSGDLQDAKPSEVVAWLLFFPSIIAGPMQRFQDWQTQRLQDRGPTVVDIAEGCRRLVMGLVLKFVLADTLYGATLAGMSREALARADAGRLALAACLYTVYLYWDFSGYSHMAIGIGRFWGVRLPENFRWPFVARNLAEFWNRWHMTLSHILRDYLFYPLSLNLKRRPFFRGHPNLALAIPPIATFAIAGVWHGAGLNLLIYGVLHGVGLAVVALLKRYPSASPLAVWWRTSRLAYVMATAITFAYVTITFVFFVLPLDSLRVALTGR